MNESISKLNEDEKFALMVALMRDLRGGWGHAYERVDLLIELAEELNQKKTLVLANSFQEAIKGDYEDGRAFRQEFTDGGYENVETLLQTKKLITIHWSKVSHNLILAINTHCEFPEYLVEDFEVWYDEIYLTDVPEVIK